MFHLESGSAHKDPLQKVSAGEQQKASLQLSVSRLHCWPSLSLAHHFLLTLEAR